MIDLYSHLFVERSGRLGQQDEGDGAKTREQVRQGFSNLEKIMLAGVLVSAAGLVWNIYRSG